jgi:hypothetical protein
VDGDKAPFPLRLLRWAGLLGALYLAALASGHMHPTGLIVATAVGAVVVLLVVQVVRTRRRWRDWRERRASRHGFE